MENLTSQEEALLSVMRRRDSERFRNVLPWLLVVGTLCFGVGFVILLVW